MQELKVGQVWRTHGGDRAKILSRDEDSAFPFIGLVREGDTDFHETWRADGRTRLHIEHSNDLKTLLSPSEWDGGVDDELDSVDYFRRKMGWLA